MASFNVLFMQCIMLIGFFLISSSNGNLAFSEKIDGNVINSICSQISNKNYCLGILTSDPRIKTSDPKGVAGILVQKAYLDASATKRKAALLASKEKNAQLQHRYSVIAAYHSIIVDRLNNVKGNLKDTNNIFIQAEASLVKIYSCEDLFLFPAPKEPTDLFTRVMNMDYLLNMIMVDVDLIPK